MRRSVWVALATLTVLAGCAVPTGGAIPECDPGMEPVAVAVPEAGVQAPAVVSLECYRVVRESRIEVLFTMPPGPECYGISVVDAVENADAVSIELQVGRIVNPVGGACAETESLRAVQVELNRPIDGRQVLDRSRPSS